MKRIFTIFLALVTVMALAVPALAKKGGKPGNVPKVTLSIEASLYQAHEVGDLIVYTINVVNNSGVDLTVEDSLTGFGPITVADGETFEPEVKPDYPVVGDDFTGDPAAVVINRLTAKDGANNVVASATAETQVFAAYPDCDPDGDGRFAGSDGYGVCIWKPAVHGDWTFNVTPAAPGKRPVTITMNLRDDVPGNWCSFDPHSVQQWRGEPEVLTFEVNLPDIPPDWHGEAICPNGGAGGDFFGVGTPGSFYLAMYGDYQVTTIAPSDEG